MPRPRTLLLLHALLLMLSLPLPGARADAGTDRLRHADSLARSGDWDGAVEALPPLGALERDHLPLLWRVAPALHEQRPETAARLLAAIRRLDPDAARPRIALETFWTDYPALPTLFADDLPFFPVEAETLALPASEGRPATKVVTVLPRPYLPLSPATDPRSGRSYQRAISVYVERGAALTLRFVVHFDAAEDTARARQVGRFLGALSVLSDGLLGAVSRAGYPVRVWLRPDGPPGAEQWAGAITVRGARAERSGLEWARQLAHEWGHATLPGVQGFSEPEAWANGDLGERLYLPRMAGAGWLIAWEPGLDAAPYIRRYVDPLRAAFAKTGPVPRLVRDTTRAGYDHFLGAALYIESAYGTDALVAALDDMNGQRAADFLDSFQRTLARKAVWTVTRYDNAGGASPTCFPVAGQYMLEERGESRAASAAKPARRFPAGWTMLNWSGALTVRRAADPAAAPIAPNAGARAPETPNARKTHGRSEQIRAPGAHRQQ